jgi:hypothetical protein
MNRRDLLSKAPMVVVALSTLSNPTLRNHLTSSTNDLEKHSENCHCLTCLKGSIGPGEQAE